jgi:hypothetical protein
MNRNDVFPMVNPYAPPASNTEVRASGRSCLGLLFVVTGMSVGVALVIARPFLGFAVLAVTHIIDRRFFGGPPFLGGSKPGANVRERIQSSTLKSGSGPLAVPPGSRANLLSWAKRSLSEEADEP